MKFEWGRGQENGKETLAKALDRFFFFALSSDLAPGHFTKPSLCCRAWVTTDKTNAQVNRPRSKEKQTYEQRSNGNKLEDQKTASANTSSRSVGDDGLRATDHGWSPRDKAEAFGR
jgi:hypothetical protein